MVRLSYEQLLRLKEKIGNDPELAELFPIYNEIDSLISNRRNTFLKSLECSHEWDANRSGMVYPTMGCKHCGLLYQAKDKKRVAEDFEKEHLFTLNIY